MPERHAAIPPPRERPAGGTQRMRGLRIRGAIAATGLAALALLSGCGGDSDTATDTGGIAGPQAQKTVRVVSESGLSSAVSPAGYPVYWVGPRGGVKYEVTLITDGRTYVRYLPPSEKAQTENKYLTVGTYAQVDALAVLKRLAKEPGQNTVAIPGGGLALEHTGEGAATGVYAAYPGVDTQIEVFDPKPGRALELAKSGALSQVE